MAQQLVEPERGYDQLELIRGVPRHKPGKRGDVQIRASATC